MLRSRDSISRPADHRPALPPEQQRTRAQCHHPTGSFIPFPPDFTKRSISDRFEAIVRRHSEQPAIVSAKRTYTYAEVNTTANRIAHALLGTTGSRQQPVALLFGQWAPARLWRKICWTVSPGG